MQLIPTGTCGLHTLHNAFKIGLKHFLVSTFLRNCYYLFSNSPATRGKFLATFEDGKEFAFPKKYCAVRWLENSSACETILKIFEKIQHFVMHPKENELKVGKLLTGLQTSFNDKLMSVDFASTLRDFQSKEPKLPFLFTAINSLLKNLLR